MYHIEVDGELFEVKNGKEASDLLDQVVQMAGDAEVVIEVIKPPRITVKTAALKPTKSKKLLKKVEETKDKVVEIYKQRAAELKRQREMDNEISSLMVKKMGHENEESALIALLM